MNATLTYTTTWMNCKNIMLSKQSQMQKVICYMISCTENIQNRYNHKQRKQTGICQGWSNSSGKQEVRVSSLGDKTVSDLDRSKRCTTLPRTDCYSFINLKILHFVSCEFHVNKKI